MWCPLPPGCEVEVQMPPRGHRGGALCLATVQGHRPGGERCPMSMSAALDQHAVGGGVIPSQPMSGPCGASTVKVAREPRCPGSGLHPNKHTQDSQKLTCFPPSPGPGPSPDHGDTWLPGHPFLQELSVSVSGSEFPMAASGPFKRLHLSSQFLRSCSSGLDE